MKSILALSLAAAAGLAQADTIGVHMVSNHPGRSDLNGLNPGLYWRSDGGWTAGGYYNSVHRLSLYAGHTFDAFDGRVQLTVGAISGYKAGLRPMPMLVPSVRVHDRFRIAFVPQFSKVSQTFHLTYELDWK